MITNAISLTGDFGAICLGRRGENEATQIVFDVSPLIANYGNGIPVVMNKRVFDATAYPVTTVFDNHAVYWTITNIETAYTGQGTCELWWFVGDVLAKTIVWNTYVAQDIGNSSETPPDPFETWLEQLTALAAETEQNAEDAEAWADGERNGEPVSDTDETYHNNAKYYSELAQQGADVSGWVSFYIDENGNLHYVRTEDVDLSFYIDENGNLHVTNGVLV